MSTIKRSFITLFQLQKQVHELLTKRADAFEKVSHKPVCVCVCVCVCVRARAARARVCVCVREREREREREKRERERERCSIFM